MVWLRAAPGEYMSISQANLDALFSDVAASRTPPAPDPPAGGSAPLPIPEQVDSSRQSKPTAADVERILRVPVPVIVTLAERDMAVELIVKIRVGTIIEFEVPFDSELTLHVANRSIGCGQGVKVGENFGLRISHIGTVEERIKALGTE